MTVSRDNSLAVYEGIKATGVRFLTALPETWLLYLLQLADDDPDMCLVEVAKEEEAIGIASGAYFSGTPNILLLQNHGFLASINGIVSLALLYKIPRIVVGENRNFQGPEEYVRSRGVELVILDDSECVELMEEFIRTRPDLWNEDIGSS